MLKIEIYGQTKQNEGYLGSFPEFDLQAFNLIPTQWVNKSEKLVNVKGLKDASRIKGSVDFSVMVLPSESFDRVFDYKGSNLSTGNAFPQSIFPINGQIIIRILSVQDLDKLAKKEPITYCKATCKKLEFKTENVKSFKPKYQENLIRFPVNVANSFDFPEIKLEIQSKSFFSTETYGSIMIKSHDFYKSMNRFVEVSGKLMGSQNSKESASINFQIALVIYFPWSSIADQSERNPTEVLSPTGSEFIQSLRKSPSQINSPKFKLVNLPKGLL